MRLIFFIMASSLSEILNRYVFQDALEETEYLEVVTEIGEIMYQNDPMGLRGFHVPSNEYMPEALALTSWVAFGTFVTEPLLTGADPQSKREISRDELKNAATQVLMEYFGYDHIVADDTLAQECLDLYVLFDLAIHKTSRLGSSSEVGFLNSGRGEGGTSSSS